MAISLEFEPEIERSLQEQANAKGMSLTEFVQEIVVREAKPRTDASPGSGKELMDIGARVRGLFTDEEIDAMFSRNPSVSRPIDLS
jgi:hypothetical protein